MSVTLTRPAWTTDLEIEIFNKLIDNHAPHLPKTRLHDPRSPATPEELENFIRFRIGGAAHDLFIVQVCAKVDQIPDDPELQLFLSRQLGDDGAHAPRLDPLKIRSCVNSTPRDANRYPLNTAARVLRRFFVRQHTRQRVLALSGHDPIEEIQQQVQKHWDYMGDLAVRNWQGFLAFELHYELHIVASLLLNSRTSKINDPESGKFAQETILPDEAVHRLGVVDWWQRKYDQASPAEQAELAAQVLAADEEGQRRRNPYLKEYGQVTQRGIGCETEALPTIYDAWRQEVLSYFLNIPIAKLPRLVSVSE